MARFYNILDIQIAKQNKTRGEKRVKETETECVRDDESKARKTREKNLYIIRGVFQGEGICPYEITTL